MVKLDDSSLTPDQLSAVEKRARKLLDRASVWRRFPTPINDILEAARAPDRSSQRLRSRRYFGLHKKQNG